MTMAQTSVDAGRLLRGALTFDAIGSALNGVAYLAGAGLLARELGLPVALLVPLGAVLLGWTGVLLRIATRPRLSRRAGLAVVVLNAVWVVDSVALLASGVDPVTRAGEVWILLQAALVAGVAALEYAGVRRLP